MIPDHDLCIFKLRHRLVGRDNQARDARELRMHRCRHSWRGFSQCNQMGWTRQPPQRRSHRLKRVRRCDTCFKNRSNVISHALPPEFPPKRVEVDQHNLKCGRLSKTSWQLHLEYRYQDSVTASQTHGSACVFNVYVVGAAGGT